MFRNMKLGYRIGLGFALVLVLAGGLVFYVSSQFGSMQASVDLVVHDRMLKTSQANTIIDLARRV